MIWRCFSHSSPSLRINAHYFIGHAFEMKWAYLHKEEAPLDVIFLVEIKPRRRDYVHWVFAFVRKYRSHVISWRYEYRINWAELDVEHWAVFLMVIIDCQMQPGRWKIASIIFATSCLNSSISFLHCEGRRFIINYGTGTKAAVQSNGYPFPGSHFTPPVEWKHLECEHAFGAES